MFFSEKDNTMSKYKKYREVGKVLNHKIIDCFISRKIILKSGKYLGITKKETLIFDSELETAALMDFAINEYQTYEKNAVELYKENVMIENDMEMDILEALLKSFTSLYKIADIDRQNNRLILDDLLDENSVPLEITDMGFSQTALPGLLMFTRVVPLADFNMTGGFGFVFRVDLEEYLLKEYKRLARKVKSPRESIKKYVPFSSCIDGMVLKQHFSNE
jgi:hypothetical protein